MSPCSRADPVPSLDQRRAVEDRTAAARCAIVPTNALLSQSRGLAGRGDERRPGVLAECRQLFPDRSVTGSQRSYSRHLMSPNTFASAVFEELNGAFMFLRRPSRLERTQVPPLPALRV